MVNNDNHPYKKPSKQEVRTKLFEEALDDIITRLDSNPAFYGMESEVNFKIRSLKFPTRYGTVMYYLSSGRWQWKREVHIGNGEAFEKWLEYFVKTGVSNRVPEKTTLDTRRM